MTRVSVEAAEKASMSLSKKSAAFFPSMNSPAERLLSLQKSHGNRAVRSILKFYTGISGQENEPYENESNADQSASPRIIQARLKIGQPNDEYEQEADQMAEAIVSKPSSSEATADNQTQTLGIQRQGREETEEIEVHAKLTDNIGPQDTRRTIENQIDSLSGRGQEMPDSVKSYFEPRFGQDFGSVRLHRDSRAAELAQSLNARAFTVGRDIVFGAGEYAPHSLEGKRLIAHELTHVLQQSDGRAVIRRKIEYKLPSYTRMNPIGRILGDQPVGLTTPTFNGIQPVDPARGRTPQETQQLYGQAGQTILDAFTPKAINHRPSAKECSFADFDATVSSNVIVPTQPSTGGWSMNFPGSNINNAQCSRGGNVPVTMIGKPDNADALKFVEDNEQEHVDDLKRLYDRSLEPYFKWLLGLKGTGDDGDKCQASLMNARGNKDVEMVQAFLRDWSTAINGRDAGGRHNLKNKINIKNNCSSVEIESSR